MPNLQILPNPELLAEEAAHLTAKTLNSLQSSRALWVLSGGTAPLKAYEILVNQYKDKIKWENITFVIGDERIIKSGQEGSNWEEIERIFLSHLAIPSSNLIKPLFNSALDKAAQDYAHKLKLVLQEFNGQIDLLWLGLGEDGHTLSIFPGHKIENKLVTRVMDSPKPPPERISLTPKALTKVKNTLILVQGENKSAILKSALANNAKLPINVVVNQLTKEGSSVKWLIDKAAASLL